MNSSKSFFKCQGFRLEEGVRRRILLLRNFEEHVFIHKDFSNIVFRESIEW